MKAFCSFFQGLLALVGAAVFCFVALAVIIIAIILPPSKAEREINQLWGE